jgi:hypothetical protein
MDNLIDTDASLDDGFRPAATRAATNVVLRVRRSNLDVVGIGNVVRIFRTRYPYRREQWFYFFDHARKKVSCRSGYEALFATWLVSRHIPFEYESLRLVTEKRLYIPDFFLPDRGEFVELKGRVRDDDQARKIALFREKGLVIRVLDWVALRAAICSPYLNYKCFSDAARARKQEVRDFIAGGSWIAKRPKPLARKVPTG